MCADGGSFDVGGNGELLISQRCSANRHPSTTNNAPANLLSAIHTARPQPTSTSTPIPIITPTPQVVSPMTVAPGALGSPEQPIVVAAFPGPPFLEASDWHSNFARRLSAVTGLSIKVVMLNSFQATVEGMARGEIQVASFFPLDYFVAHRAGYAEVAMLMPSPDATSLLSPIGFVANADRGFKPSHIPKQQNEYFRRCEEIVTDCAAKNPAASRKPRGDSSRAFPPSLYPVRVRF